ncbi:MAG: tetratricopeptide repeat protein [Planctomycetota bacterium]|jgi:tetratricopeptide (TPR) repeat protein
MKAAHRHELKTNELAEWIANLPRWAKENIRMIIYVSVVAVLAVGSYAYFRYQKSAVLVREQHRLTELIGQLGQNKRDILTAQTRGVDISYILLRLADTLQTFARNARSDQRAALALIKRAEALRAELHYRSTAVSKRDITDQTNRAKDSYNEALERIRKADSPTLASQVSPSSRSLAAMAEFGLGLCEEELENFEGAKQIYSDLTANADFQDTVAVVQAKWRLEALADYRRKVVFSAAPRPKPTRPVETPVPFRPPDISTIGANIPGVNLAVLKPVPAPREPDRSRLEVPSADTNLANLADANMVEP